MKYPITPEYLENAPDPLVRLMHTLEEDILTDICRRLRVSGELTESAIAQIRLLMERGYDMTELHELIRKRLNLAATEYDEILKRAIERNAEYYDQLITAADIFPSARIDTAIVEAIRRQSLDEFVNLTQSLGFAVEVNGRTEFLPIAEAYQRVLSNAAIQVQSGAFSPQQAISNAVKALAESGIQVVEYKTGWRNRVDVAARRAIMTGVTQISSQYTEMAAEIVQTDLREVSAHRGARDKGIGWQNHKNWQGKVYAMNGGNAKYKDIHTACGLGEVDGLEGANCRHMHYVYVEGVSERTWTDEELANIDPPPVEFEGKKYSAYEATQMQRKLETAMRTAKRKMTAYKASGNTEQYTAQAARLQRLRTKYRSFSQTANLPLQLERAAVIKTN